MKDYLINEIKEIRVEYKICLNDLQTNKTQAKGVIPWFKLMNIKTNDIMVIISNRYFVDLNLLKPYQTELRDLITDNEDFINQYNQIDPVIFSEVSKNRFIKFQQMYSNLFNELIIKVNDAD